MAGTELASSLITLDTGAIVAIANRRDRRHGDMTGALLDDDGPWLVPAGILGETGYMLGAISTDALVAFIQDLESGAYTLHCGEDDWTRIRELVRRYDNLPLGLADASVIACAERHNGQVLTLDQRDFQIVAREGRITIVPISTP